MIELRENKERREYIHKHIPKLWRKHFGEEMTEFIDESVEGGILNYVYRVASNGKNIYLKQALEKVKHEKKIGKDLANIPLTRLKYESKYIGVIKPKMPPEIELPEVLEYDEENNVLILSDIKKDGVLLETSMLDGNFNENIAYLLGKFLGISHKSTISKKIVIRGSEEEDMKHWHIFLNMRTKGILERGHLPPEVEREIKSVYDIVKSKHTYPVVINMDCCPKNVFEREDGSIGLIDFELASGIGDPAYDLGFLIGHYLLIGIIKKDKIADAIKAMKEILKGYDDEMENLKDSKHNERVIKYSGMVLPYRIASSSPAPYIRGDIIHLIPLIKKVGFSWITERFDNGFDDAFISLKKTMNNS